MRLQKREDFLHTYCSRAVKTPSGSLQHSLTHPERCCWTLVTVCLTSGFWPGSCTHQSRCPQKPFLAVQAVGVGGMMDKCPDSLLLQLENSVLLLLKFPKGTALHHPHLDKTPCVGFLLSASCLPNLDRVTLPWSPLPQKPLAPESLAQVCSQENLNQDILFSWSSLATTQSSLGLAGFFSGMGKNNSATLSSA